MAMSTQIARRPRRVLVLAECKVPFHRWKESQSEGLEADVKAFTRGVLPSIHPLPVPLLYSHLTPCEGFILQLSLGPLFIYLSKLRLV